jgi:hypothetical protein
MQEHELGDTAVANEVLKLPIKKLLSFLLPDDSMTPVVPRAIEKSEACHLASSPHHVVGAEIIEAVSSVLS